MNIRDQCYFFLYNSEKDSRPSKESIPLVKYISILRKLLNKSFAKLPTLQSKKKKNNKKKCILPTPIIKSKVDKKFPP